MSDLETRLVKLERRVKTFSIATDDGVGIDWPAYEFKNLTNDSDKPHAAQLAELEHQWKNCQLLGDGSTVRTSGSMHDGWVVNAGAIESSGASDSGGAPPPPCPNNDPFECATLITGSSGSVDGDNTDFTTDAGHADAIHRSAWFKWVCPADGNYRFDTLGSVLLGDGFPDTVLAVYTGSSVDALTQVCFDDDRYECSEAPSTVDVSNIQYTSEVNITATEGTTYYICVGGYDDSEFGPYTLNWERSPQSVHLVLSSISTDLGCFAEGPIGNQYLGNLDATIDISLGHNYSCPACKGSSSYVSEGSFFPGYHHYHWDSPDCTGTSTDVTETDFIVFVWFDKGVGIWICEISMIGTGVIFRGEIAGDEASDTIVPNDNTFFTVGGTVTITPIL